MAGVSALIDAHVPRGLLRLGRGRTVVLGSHTSRIDTHALDLHGRGRVRPRGSSGGSGPHPRAAGIVGQLPRGRGRTSRLPRRRRPPSRWGGVACRARTAPPDSTSLTAAVSRWSTVSDHAVRPSRFRSSTTSRTARRARLPLQPVQMPFEAGGRRQFTGARASRCSAAAKPAASQPAPPPQPRRRGRSLTASQGGRCPPKGPADGPRRGFSPSEHPSRPEAVAEGPRGADGRRRRARLYGLRTPVSPPTSTSRQQPRPSSSQVLGRRPPGGPEPARAATGRGVEPDVPPDRRGPARGPDEDAVAVRGVVGRALTRRVVPAMIKRWGGQSVGSPGTRRSRGRTTGRRDGNGRRE